MGDSLSAHYENLFSDPVGELYEPLAGMNLAAHNRRMEILDKIDLPTLENSTVVDYGVGAWGFGCIFPRLKKCANPIGIDVSASAIRKSAEASRADPMLSHTEVKYLTSLGYEIKLHSGSVDIFFCGECIEHVEDTDAFLTEIHRVMRPGGMVIFTTPNASPYAYRQLGLRWCVGFEHVALMDYTEVNSYISRFFDIRKEYGFNQTIFPGLDPFVPPDTIDAWVRSAEEDPANASSLVIVARRGKESIRPVQNVIQVDWSEMRLCGDAVAQELVPNVQGGRLVGRSSFDIAVPPGMTRCSIIFWSHDWSGVAGIQVDDVSHEVSLYSHAGGCFRYALHDLRAGQLISIRSPGRKESRSADSQVIVYRLVFGGAA